MFFFFLREPTNLILKVALKRYQQLTTFSVISFLAHARCSALPVTVKQSWYASSFPGERIDAPEDLVISLITRPSFPITRPIKWPGT